MMRIILMLLFPLVVPFVTYSAWAWWRRRKGRSIPGDGPPTLWLLFAGVALVLLTLAGVSLSGGEEPGGRYVAPRLLPDGRIEPGHVER
jgi:hypothetical protein